MGCKCSFKHCPNYSKNFRLFSVPKVHTNSINLQHNRLQAQRRKAWLKALNLTDNPQLLSKRLRICSSHFSSGTPAHLHDIDNIDWAPSINICSRSEETQNSQNDEDASNSNAGSVVTRDGFASDIDTFILPKSFKKITLFRSLGTQTDTDELNEKMIEDEISAPAVSLDINSGTNRQSFGVQTVDYSLNDVKYLRQRIKDLTLQLEYSKKESENLKEQVACLSKKQINLKIENIKLSAGIKNQNFE